MSVTTSFNPTFTSKTYVSGESFSYFQQGSIIYALPSNLSGLHHFRISLLDVWIENSYTFKVKRIFGYVYQEDSTGNVLKSDYIDLSRGSETIIEAASNVAVFKINTTFEFEAMRDSEWSIGVVISGSGNTFLNVKCEDVYNNVLHEANVICSIAYGTSKAYEETIISGLTPTRVFSLPNKNLWYLLYAWLIQVEVLEGDTSDSTLKVEMLDADDNVIFTKTYSPVSNTLDILSHYSNLDKFRLTLETPKKLKIRVKVGEGRRTYW